MADTVTLVRHGATQWSVSGQHTSTTDLPLTEVGVRIATDLAGRLDPDHFDLVLSSPRQRARETARLAGFADPEIDADLAEWDYGDYEGITTLTIRETVPGWTVWSHPTPGGETADQVGARLDRVVTRVTDEPGRTLVFGHGHALRVLTARWLGLPVPDGRLFASTPRRFRCWARTRQPGDPALERLTASLDADPRRRDR